MSLIKALITPVTPFQQNAPILFCEDTKKCAFVDPGGDLDILLGAAKDNNLIPEKILLTHGHIDHAGGASELASMLSIEIEGPHKEDTFLLDSLGNPVKKYLLYADLQFLLIAWMQALKLLQHGLCVHGLIRFFLELNYCL